MTVTLRPTDWRDLKILHYNRNKGLYLDTARVLTRGGGFASGILRSFLSPNANAFTWVCADDCGQDAILGQFSYAFEAPYARLTVLAPEDALDSPWTIDLLEGLARQAGEHGAYQLLAEIDEGSKAFQSLRKAGFVVYARQRIWKLRENGDGFNLEIPWETPVREQISAAQSLYHSLVPGLVQQIEPLPNKKVRGMVCYDESEILGYVDLKFGPRGVWAQPFIHPDTANVGFRLRDLFESIPNRRSRPVYLCVRSYQSWLESALERIDAKAGPQQVVLVKRLTAQLPVKRPFTLPQIDGQQEISTPVAQTRRNS